ncbi:5-bromo-4-chloroindolyl phosphate hydrolysis family protein [uncultured Roseovarius sp.]|uniref:5-bromo-4-chloroindolyl phosphate hydrolysis family protein n=1 Tax=uncultured Roseovarius sp. TaxID=293344 RepID=UPI00261C63D2|nr:5-bromo-4-chloroindolyl phosphate hydrolysis family protein [uncultured Roseovarius sp.]
MAQRYGGKYSPDGTAPDTSTDRGSFQGAKRTRAGGRVNLLFLAPLPLIWSAFGNGPVALALNLAALGSLLLAAWMTREGILAQEAYEARKVARRPGFPRKMSGSLLTGIGLALAGFAASGGIVAPVIYGIIGTVLHSFAFGLDPMKDKGLEGVDQFQTDRVARAVEKAETHLAAMSDAIKRAGDRQAESRVERFQTSVRDMLRTVENDPRDLTAARKYMGIYLVGARDATVKFADIYARSRDAGARSDYMMLLTDLEENFVAKTQKLLADSHTDLEIEIDVLRDRLQREGIRPERQPDQQN